MMLDESFLAELRARVPVSSVVGRRVALVKAGRELQGLCPFHNEKTPSFTVSDQKAFYHCFGCGAHGDVIEFEMRAGGLSFLDAVARLADEAGLDVPQATDDERRAGVRRATLHEACEAACAFFEGQLRGSAGRAAIDYLTRRGVTGETAERFRLGWSPERDGVKSHLTAQGFPEATLLEAGLLRQGDDGRMFDVFRGRVIFPITDPRGRVVGFGARSLGDAKPKYLNTPETPLFNKGALLYGQAHARGGIAESGGVVMVEGYMDVIAMHQAGLANAVAPLGTAVTERQLSEAWKMAPSVVICLDGDTAGARAVMRLVDRAMPSLCAGRDLRFATVAGAKDPDELIRTGRVEELRAAIGAARPLVDIAWDMATADAADTPEARAAVERALFARASQIKDVDVRRHYLAEFRRRLRCAAGPKPVVLVGRRKDNFAPGPCQGGLIDEWLSARSAADTEQGHAWLESRGVPWEGLASIGGIGFARGRAAKGRWVAGDEFPEIPAPVLWEPCEEGERLVVIPEWEGGPGGPLVDLIAWNPRTDVVAHRSGFGVVLGEDVVLEALGFEARGLSRPVEIAESPLSWLRMVGAGARPVLIVDWRRAWDVLGALSRVVAESIPLGESLQRRLKPPRAHQPKIQVDSDSAGVV